MMENSQYTHQPSRSQPGSRNPTGARVGEEEGDQEEVEAVAKEEPDQPRTGWSS